MSKRLLGIGDVYTYDYKQVHKTRNVGFGYYDPNKVSTTSSTDGYVLVDGVLSVVNEDGSSEPGPEPDPYNPLGLPPYTLRIEFYGSDREFDPTDQAISIPMNGSWTHVSGSVWDWTYENSNWGSSTQSVFSYMNKKGRFNYVGKRFNVLGGNTTNVTDMSRLFNGNRYITNFPIIDTSNVSSMKIAFNGPTNNPKSILSSIPLLPTDSLQDATDMFKNCYNVKSGALDLYNQMLTQTNPPTAYNGCFTNCGSNTETGSAELAQIPTDWGGTME